MIIHADRLSHLPKALSRETISCRLSWKLGRCSLDVGRASICRSENKILRDVPNPWVWWRERETIHIMTASLNMHAQITQQTVELMFSPAVSPTGDTWSSPRSPWSWRCWGRPVWRPPDSAEQNTLVKCDQTGLWTRACSQSLSIFTFHCRFNISVTVCTKSVLQIQVEDFFKSLKSTFGSKTLY